MSTTQDTTIVQDAQQLRHLREVESSAKAQYERIKQARERIEADLIERMRAEEVDSLKSDGTNFVPASTTYGQIQDRGEFVTWAEENEPELLETKERKQLINQLARERLDNGEPLPPGMGFYVKEYVSLRAA